MLSPFDLPPSASPARVTYAGARHEWRSFVFAVFGATAYGVLTVLTATVVGHLTQTVLGPAVTHHHFSAHMAWQVIWQLGGVVLLNVIAVIIRRIAAGITYNQLIASTRGRVTRAYQTLPMAWHQSRPAGRLLSVANSDVETIWNIFQPLPMALGVVVMLLFGFVSIFLVDVTLGLVALVIFPLLIVINIWFQRVMRVRVEASQAARADVSGVADESFDGAIVVKALGRADAETERFRAVATRLRNANVRLGRTEGLFDPLTSALPTIGTLLVVLVGAHRVKSGSLSAGDVVQVAYLFSLLAWPVRAFGWILFSLPQVAIGWGRVKPVLDDAQSAPQVAGATLLPSGPLALNAAGVNFSYEGVEGPALRDVHVAIAPGETLALVGATGAGKSTLAHVLVGLLPASSGRVEVGGVAVQEAADRENRIALATQEAFVFDESTRANVTLGRQAVGDEQFKRALDVSQASDFVYALPDGAEEPLGERGSRLSGGQRQRVALARVLADDPGLVVLDDATSAIDPAIEADILNGIADATARTSAVIVAHRRSAILIADRVLFLDAGTVAGHGTHEELMRTNAAYARLLTAYESEESVSAEIGESETTASPEHAGHLGAHQEPRRPKERHDDE